MAGTPCQDVIVSWTGFLSLSSCRFDPVRSLSLSLLLLGPTDLICLRACADSCANESCCVEAATNLKWPPDLVCSLRLRSILRFSIHPCTRAGTFSSLSDTSKPLPFDLSAVSHQTCSAASTAPFHEHCALRDACSQLRRRWPAAQRACRSRFRYKKRDSACPIWISRVLAEVNASLTLIPSNAIDMHPHACMAGLAGWLVGVRRPLLSL